MGGLRQFILSGAKSAGRNSAGRITIFHRGGGAKRLQRKIDLKRSTSSMGIVERIEYDPNRSSRIALVRWIEGVDPRNLNTPKELASPPKIPDPTSTTIRGVFSFSSLPGMAGQRKVDSVSSAPAASYAVVGSTTKMSPPSNSEGSGTKKTSAKDVFFSSLSSSEADGSIGFPRIAVAGAKPSVFAPGMRDDKLGEKNTFSLDEVRKWRRDSVVWAHRIKRKAAISWSSEPKVKTGQGSLAAKQIAERPKDRAAVTYIIASHELEAGKMVMNCDWSKNSNAQNAHSYY
ncbi:hypothetical protein PTKIN_Ptkin11bG0037500 [Pterospermum kingtungense]